MFTPEDLRAYCESRFPVGEPTYGPLSVTGEPYVEIGQEIAPDNLTVPGVVREGKERECGFDMETAYWSAYWAFCNYAKDKTGTLYWRVPPELMRDGGRYLIYLRCLISDKPVLTEHGKKAEAA